jgi:dTDP-4-amino-4,6-dideoxygalactose transaminase
MTDLQAALGVSQIERVDQYVGRRNELARRYDQLLAGLPIITPWQHPDGYSAWHLYVIRLQLDKIPHLHCQVFESLLKQHIGVNLHYIPVHTQPYYRAMGFRLGRFPVAEAYYEEAISLPIYAALNDAQQDEVVNALKTGLRA